MRKLVIILNGPPLSGKDTIGNNIINRLNWGHLEFKRELYKVAGAIAGMTAERFEALHNADKCVTHKHLGDVSTREYLIWASECVTKPRHGSEVFGLRAAQAVANSDHSILVATDGGFVPEVDAVAKVADVIVVQIERDGRTFAGDSRTYIGTKDFTHSRAVLAGRIENNATIEQASAAVLDRVIEAVRALHFDYSGALEHAKDQLARPDIPANQPVERVANA